MYYIFHLEFTGIYENLHYHLFSTIDNMTSCFSTINFKILLAKNDSWPWFVRSVSQVSFYVHMEKSLCQGSSH